MAGKPNWSRAANRGRPTKAGQVYDWICKARTLVADVRATGAAVEHLGEALEYLDEAEQLQGDLVVSEAGRQGG